MGCISNFETTLGLALAKKAMSMVDPNDTNVNLNFKEALVTVKRAHSEPN